MLTYEYPVCDMCRIPLWLLDVPDGTPWCPLHCPVAVVDWDDDDDDDDDDWGDDDDEDDDWDDDDDDDDDWDDEEYEDEEPKQSGGET